MELTAKRLREVLDYSPETGFFYWRERRGSAAAGSVAGVIAADGARVVRVDGVLYRAHRLACLHVNGGWPKNEIDHINGDPSDNRIENLRDCERRENARNVRCHADTASGMKGAYRDRKSWSSRICVDGVSRHLGTFKTAGEAAAAYDAAALRLHGKFARINGAA